MNVGGTGQESQTLVRAAIGKFLRAEVIGLFVQIVGLLIVLTRFSVLAPFVQRSRTLGHSGNDSNDQ